MMGYDVGIIGGGVHGASAAFHLAERGVRTVLFERGGPASGPTGRSSAVCRAYYSQEFLARVAREAMTLFESFADVTGGGDAGFHRTGALFLHPAEDGPEIRATAERLNAIGTKTEIVDRDQLDLRFPGFELDGIAHGAWEPEAGYADPVSTTQSLLDRAAAGGAVIRLDTPVDDLAPRPAGGAIVTAVGEAVEVDRLLLAAGPWTRMLAHRVGVDLPLTVERHIVATFGIGGADPVPFVFADLPGGYYHKPEGDSQFFLGPLHAEPPVDPDAYDPEITEGETLSLAGRLVDRVPSLGDSIGRGGWASLYDISPDWQPVIGEIADGVFVDAGTSGHGFKLAPALGRHVADLVTGGPADPGIAAFHPDRFLDGGALTGGYGQAKILG